MANSGLSLKYVETNLEKSPSEEHGATICKKNIQAGLNYCRFLVCSIFKMLVQIAI